MFILMGIAVMASVQMHVQASLGDWKMEFLGKAQGLMRSQMVHEQGDLYERVQVQISKLHALEIAKLQMEAFKQVRVATQRVDEVVQGSDEQLSHLAKGLQEKGKEDFQDLIEVKKQSISETFKETKLGDAPTYTIGQVATTTQGALRLKVEDEVKALEALYESVLEKYNQCDEEVMKSYYKKKLEVIHQLYQVAKKNL